ncbi:MAG: class I SAM-dependent methyltransferase [Peptococcaceae bacterium]
MGLMKVNDYGRLCTEMYEYLHAQAPADELAFYLSYAKKEARILEALCGSGRFLVPFLERGYAIEGLDASPEMLDKLKAKSPRAVAYEADLITYTSEVHYDYIFVSSGSMSLFTDEAVCLKVLRTLKNLLAPSGVLVFAVDTVANRCADDMSYRVTAEAVLAKNKRLVLRSKNRYDVATHTQFSPGIYELYEGDILLQAEKMDFQTHLYTFGEMERHLQALGFTDVHTYADFDKTPAIDDGAEMFLFECRC